LPGDAGLVHSRERGAATSWAQATLLLAGLEYRLSPALRITPNLIWTTCGVNSDGVRPDDDLHLRLTLFLDLE
jgi:hypothetical protein